VWFWCEVRPKERTEAMGRWERVRRIISAGRVERVVGGAGEGLRDGIVAV
jgi:hypothetical protein